MSSSQWPVVIPSGYRLCSLDMLQSVISSGAVCRVYKKGTLYMQELAYLCAGMASHLSLKCYYCQSEQVFPTSSIINASSGSGNWFYEVNRHTVYALRKDW